MALQDDQLNRLFDAVVVPHVLIGGVIIRPESPQISNWHGLLRSRGPCSEVYRQNSQGTRFRGLTSDFVTPRLW
jgi:hypothetical protein